MKDESSWVVDRAALIEAMELDADERRRLEGGADELLGALIRVAPPERAERGDVGAAPSAAPHLLIPGTKYHLNLSAVGKATLLPALQIVARAFVLDRAKLLESGLTLSATAMHALLSNLTRLSDRQLLAVRAVLDEVRARKLPDYRPSTRELAKRLGWKPKEVDAELRPLLNKAVQFDEAAEGWRVLF